MVTWCLLLRGEEEGKEGTRLYPFIAVTGPFGEVAASPSPSSPRGGFDEVCFTCAEMEEGWRAGPTRQWRRVRHDDQQQAARD
jgi:hypothetical protein